MKRDANHTTLVTLGGDKRSALIRRIRGKYLSPHAPPPTRGYCLAGTPLTGSFAERKYGIRQCEAFDCKMHLATQASRDMPGRRHGGLAPEMSVSGKALVATAPSCALDLVSENPEGMSSESIGRALGCDKRRVEQILAKFKGTIGALGIARLGSDLIGELES